MGLQFRMQFHCDNAEFMGDDFPLAVSYTVRRAMNQIEATRPVGATHSQAVLDTYGNRIGQWKIVEVDD